jgi:hypothetical protein
MTNVHLGLRMKPVTSTGAMASLLSTLCEFDEVVPHRYGDTEPLRTRFDPADIGSIAARASM